MFFTFKSLAVGSFFAPLLAPLLMLLFYLFKRFDLSVRGGNFLTILSAIISFFLSCGMILKNPANGERILKFWLFEDGLCYIDSLSIYFVFLVNSVSLFAAFFIQPYLNYLGKQSSNRGSSSRRQDPKFFHLAFNIFHWSMVAVAMINNVILLWAFVEITTITSAYLVGFRGDHSSTESAWKYVMVTSAGMLFALLGTLLLVPVFGDQALNLSNLMNYTGSVTDQQNLIKLSFLFILVGYGTKAGLAPLHTWLPDAHGEAPYAVSAMLSGVLLKSALYAILRFQSIVNLYIGSEAGTVQTIFLVVGLSSLAIAAAFILKRNPFKRVLAYHSLEHMGIIVFALGIGTSASVTAALIHALNHALTKALMFLVFGRLLSAFIHHVALPTQELWKWALKDKNLESDPGLGEPAEEEGQSGVRIARDWITQPELDLINAPTDDDAKIIEQEIEAKFRLKTDIIYGCLNRDEILERLANGTLLLEETSFAELGLERQAFTRQYPPGFSHFIGEKQRVILMEGDLENPSGILQWAPYSGFILALGGLALIGMPPFSIFVSETMIIWAGIDTGISPLEIAVFVGSLLLIFGGLLNHLKDVLLGPANKITFYHNRQFGSGAKAYYEPVYLTLPVYLTPDIEMELRNEDKSRLLWVVSILLVIMIVSTLIIFGWADLGELISDSVSPLIP